MDKQLEGKIIKVSGPLVEVEGMANCKLFDVVKIGKEQLTGEIIELRGSVASVQVYEETSGIGVGESVFSTGEPLCVELAPGLLGSIFDGIERPLDKIRLKYGDYINRGVEINSLNRDKKWKFVPTVQSGDYVKAGEILGIVNETETIGHKILLPIGYDGVIKKITPGEYTIDQPFGSILIGKIEKNLTMLQKWPIRKARPYLKKLMPTKPLITGQRIIDSLFPIALGGVASVPGPFGSGKTVVQHQLAKWSDADIIVYIGCGERGNEMTDVLNEFPLLQDPRTNKPIMQRTVLIANTSDMPVAAREASIYTGITIAEYFRDMGYNVAVMADSTSRWAEALREMSARLEEMPGEEGYPAYLGSRLAEFYERAGVVKTLNYSEGSVTAIGAVSPAGGDLSEPVSQATLRIVKVFWGLSSSLAYKRHFPAIDWLQSYSMYSTRLEDWYIENVANDFKEVVKFVMKILQEENDLLEIVRLVGSDSLSAMDRIILETAKMIREDFLHQNAFDDEDTYTPIKKQYKILELIHSYYVLAVNALEDGIGVNEILSIKAKSKISKAKYIKENDMGEFTQILKELNSQFKTLKLQSEF